MLEKAAKDDVTLDAEEFSSDFFRIYLFKVKRCPRGRPHDWTQCPYAHPGEKAKRRDPRRYQYSGTACPDFRKNGCCRRGDACPFAHGVFECWLHPARYRTQSCADGPACKRRVCFFAHVESELRKPEEDPSSQTGSQTDLAADAQLLHQQQLSNALGALLANGGPAALQNVSLVHGNNGEQHLNGEESRPLSNPLAERARQLQQQLQQLQALQALQSQQHAGGPSRSSLDGGAQVQATLARQALLQQQLQAQVDQELLPLMGGEPLGQPGLARRSSPFAPHQSSLEAMSLLHGAGSAPHLLRPVELGGACAPMSSAAGGLISAGSLPGPDMLSQALPNGVPGLLPTYAGVPGASGLGSYPLAAQRRMSLDSAIPPRPPGAGPYMNGHQPFGLESAGSGQADAALVAALQASQRAASGNLSTRSSMDLPLGPTMDGSFMHHPMNGAFGRGSLELLRQQGRASAELPPLGQRSSFDVPAGRPAGNGFSGLHVGPGPCLPQRRSVDIGAVQRQAQLPHGSLFGPVNHNMQAGLPLSQILAADRRPDSASPTLVDRVSPGLLPTSHAFPAAHMMHSQAGDLTLSGANGHGLNLQNRPYGDSQSANGTFSSIGGVPNHLEPAGGDAAANGVTTSDSRPPASHSSHVSGLPGNRLETVGEGEVSTAGAESLTHDFSLLDTGKLAGWTGLAPDSDGMANFLVRNASFDSILAELPRSLSEVAMQHGVSPAALEGPVKLDG